MSGDTAEKIWEAVAEPARRAQARMTSGGSPAEFAGCVHTLGALRLKLIELVTRDEGGVLSEISSEYAAMLNLLEARAIRAV